jgi:hypothetical protein
MAVPSRQTEENHEGFWNLAREIIEEEVANVVSFACKKCNDKFSNSENLVNHEQTQHEAPILHCDNCLFKTNSESELNSHLEKSKCNLCGDIHHLEGDMKNHIETQHKVEDLKCDACDFLTSSQALLGRHIVEHHAAQQNVAPNPPVSENSTEESGNKV